MPIAEAKSLARWLCSARSTPRSSGSSRWGISPASYCGGTHLDNVGQVGFFKIIGEESVAAGTRRIVALTGPSALEYVREEERALARLSATLRVPASQVPDRVVALLDEIKTLKKQAAQRKPDAGARTSADDLLAAARPAGGASVVIARVENASPDDLRVLIDGLRRKCDKGLAALFDHHDRRQGPARRRFLARPRRPGAARRKLAQKGRPRGGRRRRRSSRPRPGRRQEARPDPRRPRSGLDPSSRQPWAIDRMIRCSREIGALAWGVRRPVGLTNR